MAIAFVQMKAAQGTSSAASFTTTAMTTTGGNAIVSCMGTNGGALTSLNASDSIPNTYTNGVITKFISFGNVAIGVARSITGGSTTFTVTPNAARFSSISAQEYSGFGSSNEATNSGSASASAAVSPGAVNPASSNDLYVACWTHDGSVSQAFTFNVSGEGWNQRSNLTNTANSPLGSQDLVSSGSKTGSATLGTAANWEAAVATFTAAAAAATTSLLLLLGNLQGNMAGVNGGSQ